MNAELPEPLVSRWQPLRCGLLNLYKYDDQTFVFEGGRLLLRGNNGTGKSRVLALTLPFLLDGEISSHRVEPDADQNKKMEWNLLMGKRDERTGYSWLEFGRRLPDGACEFLTLGCGLRASQGRPLQRWFFITPLRIGRDLSLAKNRTPHIEATLQQLLVGKGEMFREPKHYRAAVDKRLFGLGAARYNALLNLLIQLRKPQLSRKLDEEQLSQALSEALPPLSAQVLDDVADAFRELDEQRGQLAVFREAHDAVAEFLDKYRHYIQVAARIRARAVTAAQKVWHDAQRQARHQQKVHDTAEADRQTRAAEKNQREDLASSLDARVRALTDDPGLKDMKRAQSDAEETQRHANDMQVELDAAQARVGDSEGAFAARSAQELTAMDEAVAASQNAAQQAAAAVLDQAHRDALDAIDLRTLGSDADATSAKSLLQEPVARRRTALQALGTRVAEVGRAQQTLTTARTKAEELTSEVAKDEESESSAHHSMVTASEFLARSYRGWVSTLEELRPLDADQMEEALATWLEHRTGPAPIGGAVVRAHGEAQQKIAEAMANALRLIDEENARSDELQQILNALSAGRHEPPLPPRTRDRTGREAMDGAAFWQLCDFRENLNVAERANIEAALEAAGLLDAWVLPDGRVLGPEHLDAVLETRLSSPVSADRSLHEALRVDTENLPLGFPSETVMSILSEIGYGVDAGPHWVAPDGQWQLGPLRGAWRKTEAQHIGASAREAERSRRIHAVTYDLAASHAEAERLVAERAAIVARRERAAAEFNGAPTDDEMRQAGLALDLAKQRVAETRGRLTQAENAVRQREGDLAERIAARDRDARDFGLFEHISRLDDLQTALHEYEKSLLGLWPSLEKLARARQLTGDIRQRVETDRADLARRSELSTDASLRATASRSRLETLRSTVGADVDELLSQLSTAQSELTTVSELLKEDQKKILELVAVAAGAKAAQEAAETSLALHAEIRDREAKQLHEFARHRLLTIAHDDFTGFEEGDRNTAELVGVARDVDRVLQSVPCDAEHWKDQQNSIHTHVETLRAELLPHNFPPATSQTSDGVLVVTVPYQGTVRSMTDVRMALTTEITTREAQLTRDEQNVIEKYLLNEAAHELHERLHAAEAWKQGASDELQSRPMGSGMRLRFAWEPRADGPSGLREAIKLLRRHSAGWSEKERHDLGAFLGDRIRDAHRASEGGRWQEHLAQALDYRAWHLFSVERWQDGRWERLTKKRHGTGSGGEKAVALTLPQFTAAAAFYRSAPDAPRLILLDEAFVGVDSDMRRKCMGLLTVFELDLVMTSEREWGCYPTVPALAIYQLASAADVDAVAATRWVWNGRDDPRLDERLHAGASDE